MTLQEIWHQNSLYVDQTPGPSRCLDTIPILLVSGYVRPHVPFWTKEETLSIQKARQRLDDPSHVLTWRTHMVVA